MGTGLTACTTHGCAFSVLCCAALPVTRLCPGERALASDNHPLGVFTLKGLPPKPRGKVSVKIVFDIDANGILTASAEDKAGGEC